MGRNNSDIQNLGGSLGAAMSLPIGSIVELASSSPLIEDTYLLCAGGVVNKADWPELENYVPPFTSISSLSQTDPQKVFPFLYPIGLEYFNGCYWMLNAYALSKSVDGTNWQVVLRAAQGNSFKKVKVSGDSSKLIVTATSYFQYSSDGAAWQTCTTPLADVDFNGSRWVKVYGTNAYYSDDLITWTVSTSSSYQKNEIVYFAPGSKWVTVTNRGSTLTGCFQYSTDGITFADSGIVYSTYNSQFYKLRRIKDYLFCSCDNLTTSQYYHPAFSADGATWTQDSYATIDITYSNGLYYSARWSSGASITIYSGANIGAVTTYVCSVTRNGSYINTDHGTTYGRFAAHPTNGDLLFADKLCLMKRISGKISHAEISPIAVSEDTAPDGKHAFSSGKANGILGLHFIDFSGGLFTLNTGVLTSNTYNMAFDKVFAGNAPHFWCGGMDANKYYASAMKITAQNGNCLLTAGNQCGDTTAGYVTGIKTPAPGKYVLGKCFGSNSMDFYCTDTVPSTQIIAGSGYSSDPRLSLADGICSAGPYQLNGSSPSLFSGLGTTNKSTGAITSLATNMGVLSTIVNGTAIYTNSSLFYRPGEWGLSDMTSAGPAPGALAELNQCQAGYFLIGQSGSLFSVDGYNWMPMAFKKPTSDTNAAAAPVSYTDGKLFMFDGVSTMSVFTVSDYDPQTQIQLPNIKSTKPGVNCYLKAA